MMVYQRFLQELFLSEGMGARRSQGRPRPCCSVEVSGVGELR